MRISLISILGEDISASRGLTNATPSFNTISKKETNALQRHQLMPDAALINWGSWANNPKTPPV